MTKIRIEKRRELSDRSKARYGVEGPIYQGITTPHNNFLTRCVFGKPEIRRTAREKNADMAVITKRTARLDRQDKTSYEYSLYRKLDDN